MPIIGFIGAGHIDSQVARQSVARGYDVALSHSRGPETLAACNGFALRCRRSGRALKESWRIEPNTPGYGPRRTPRRWERAWRRQSVGCRGMRALRPPAVR